MLQRIISWTESTRDGPGPGRAVHRGWTVARTEGTGARRCAHRSMASGHSEAWMLIGLGLTGLGRRRGDRATVEERKLNNCRAWVSEEGESEMGEVQ
jgi:hypothetical protein